MLKVCALLVFNLFFIISSQYYITLDLMFEEGLMQKYNLQPRKVVLSKIYIYVCRYPVAHFICNRAIQAGMHLLVLLETVKTFCASGM